MDALKDWLWAIGAFAVLALAWVFGIYVWELLG
jgi:hypothetical protein